jgi:hypothetical protein
MPPDPDSIFPLRGEAKIDLNVASRQVLDEFVSSDELGKILDNRPFKRWEDVEAAGVSQQAIDKMQASGVTIGSR